LDTPKEPTFGYELKDLRVKVNLSQRDVEGASGISSAYLSQLENNKVKKPSPFILHKLATLYGVDYELIMRYAGYIRSKTEPNAPKTLVGAALLVDGELSPEEERDLASYLQHLRARRKAVA
jgi:transcriptional regulator with XRE-family HTH domain